MPGDRPGTTRNNQGAWYHTRRLCSTAAPMKDESIGCGSNGLFSVWTLARHSQESVKPKRAVDLRMNLQVVMLE